MRSTQACVYYYIFPEVTCQAKLGAQITHFPSSLQSSCRSLSIQNYCAPCDRGRHRYSDTKTGFVMERFSFQCQQLFKVMHAEKGQ